MSKKQNLSISIGGNVSASNIVAGDRNRVQSGNLSTGGTSVDLSQVIAELKAMRAEIAAETTPAPPAIQASLGEIETELARPRPDKGLIGKALEKVIETAKSAEEFAGTLDRLMPRIVTIVSWLGGGWERLLGLLGR